MDEIVEMLGVVTLIAMAVAAATGLLMRRRRAMFRTIHTVIGFGALALAVCHGLTMVLD
jgi:hypothetical protein